MTSKEGRQDIHANSTIHMGRDMGLAPDMHQFDADNSHRYRFCRRILLAWGSKVGLASTPNHYLLLCHMEDSRTTA